MVDVMRSVRLVLAGFTILWGLLIWINFWPYLSNPDIWRGGLDVLYSLTLGVGLLLILIGVSSIRGETTQE